MAKSLDELIEEEMEAFEDVSRAFIRHTIKRQALWKRLADIRETHPEVFTQKKET